MKEYGKTFTGITDADGFIILDVPFTATVIGTTSLSGRSPQNLVCNRENMMMRVIDNTVYIDLYGLRIMLSDNTEVNLNTTDITQTIISPYKNELISAEMGYEVTSIDFNAFGDCVNLTSVVIPNSVTSIGNSAFSGCSSLTSITFTGTSSQWRAIERIGSDWHTNVPTTTAYCEGDGVTVSIDAA